MKTKDSLWSKIKPGIIPSNTEIHPDIWDFIHPESNVLEIGCGDGRIIDLLMSTNTSVTGIDINCKAIEILSKRYTSSNISLHCESILSPTLPISTFNIAFMQGVVSTIVSDERLNAFKNIHSLLKPGGILHIAEFQLDESTEEKKERYRNDAVTSDEYGTLVVRDAQGNAMFQSHNFTKDELQILLNNSGFNIIRAKETTFTSYHGNKKPGLIYLGGKA